MSEHSKPYPYPVPWKFIDERLDFVGIKDANGHVLHNGKYGLSVEVMERIIACVNFCEHMPTEILDQLASNRIGAATIIQWIKRNPTFEYNDYPTNTEQVCIECNHVRQSAPFLSHDEDCLLDKALQILGDKP